MSGNRNCVCALRLHNLIQTQEQAWENSKGLGQGLGIGLRIWDSVRD